VLVELVLLEVVELVLVLEVDELEDAEGLDTGVGNKITAVGAMPCCLNVVERSATSIVPSASRSIEAAPLLAYIV
jgi:hypothetical protein